MLRSASLFLIHILAWPWGSISSGNREAFVTIMPFWTESSSLGSPCKFHSPTVMESASISVRFSFAERGILRVCSSFFQASSRIPRKSWLKGPQYERKPDASSTSPTSLCGRETFLRGVKGKPLIIDVHLMLVHNEQSHLSI